MSKFIFCLKALIHFIWVLLTPFLSHEYYLSFTREDDGEWYIDLPNWPFAHGNLAMVCGADYLCGELSKGEDHVKVHVITSNKALYNGMIRCDREWAFLRYGGQYYLPEYYNRELTSVKEMWLCQVTLFVLGWWPKYIYISPLKN